jgi:hypothetical protein
MRSSKAADRVPQDQAATARFLSAGSRGRLLAALLFCESGQLRAFARFRNGRVLFRSRQAGLVSCWSGRVIRLRR